jgi:hypothetical protein
VQAHLGAQRVFFGPATDVYGWHYPPYFLALGALLALLPYGAALAVCSIWPEFATRCAAAASRVATVLVAALAFPAVFVNLTHGQNGFLTAGLFAGALLCLDTRPWLAGLPFALLAYSRNSGW